MWNYSLYDACMLTHKIILPFLRDLRLLLSSLSLSLPLLLPRDLLLVDRLSLRWSPLLRRCKFSHIYMYTLTQVLMETLLNHFRNHTLWYVYIFYLPLTCNRLSSETGVETFLKDVGNTCTCIYSAKPRKQGASIQERQEMMTCNNIPTPLFSYGVMHNIIVACHHPCILYLTPTLLSRARNVQTSLSLPLSSALFCLVICS